jgi:putative membrane protein
MSTKTLLATVALLASGALPLALPQFVHAQTAAPKAAQGQVAAADQQLMKDIGEANLAEIETGKLAQKNAGKQDVKAFGAMMVEDHGKSLRQLQTLATGKGVQLPDAPNAKHAAAAKALQSMTGDSFDKRYSSMAVTDHQETLALLKKVQQSAKDPELRNFASEAVPVVSTHLTHAQKLSGGK